MVSSTVTKWWVLTWMRGPDRRSSAVMTYGDPGRGAQGHSEGQASPRGTYCDIRRKRSHGIPEKIVPTRREGGMTWPRATAANANTSPAKTMLLSPQDAAGRAMWHSEKHATIDPAPWVVVPLPSSFWAEGGTHLRFISMTIPYCSILHGRGFAPGNLSYTTLPP
jgi:hypothetical protein